MPTPQEQYAEVVQQSQDAVTAAVDAWTRAVKEAFGQVPALPTQLDPNQVVDQVFDFAEKMLAVQREFARNLIKTSASIAESVAQRSRETTQSVIEEG